MIQFFKIFTLFTIPILMLLSCQTNSHVETSKETVSTEQVNYGSGDVVTKGYLDRSGNMWFTTTKEGVFKYDGKSFTRSTIEDGLCANEVWSILEDKDGFLWFGTASGLCKYDGVEFVNIPIPKYEKTSDWLEEVYPIVNPNAVTSMIQDRNGVFWIGTNGAGAYRYDGEVFTSYLKNRGALMPDTLHHNVILSILEDQLGNIWFTSFSHGGISKYDRETFFHYDKNNGLKDDMIASSYMDPSGDLWFGTRAGGISHFDGKNFETIQEADGPCQNNMATLLEDQKGRLWSGSYARSGVCWYDGNSFVPLEVEGSKNLKDIKTISEDKAGHIWFGGRYGILWRFDGEKLEDFTNKKRG